MNNREAPKDKGGARRWRYGPPRGEVWSDVVPDDATCEADVILDLYTLRYGTIDTRTGHCRAGQPDSAILCISHSLARCSRVNGGAYAARASTESFGSILRIAAGDYGHLDTTRQTLILQQVFDWLRQVGAGVAPFYTQTIASPELLRDILLHDSRYSPGISASMEVLSYSDTEIDAMVVDQKPGLATFACALITRHAPLEIRQHIQTRHPVLVQQAIQIWAAQILNHGARQEVYAQAHPDSKAQILGWEESMRWIIQGTVAIEYQLPVARAITDPEITAPLVDGLGGEWVQTIVKNQFDLDPRTIQFTRNTAA